MIVKPENMDFSNKNIIMIISGLPGVGKTTLALSAPEPILIDADEGIVRVNPAHRKDTIIARTYEELLEDLKGLIGYKTVIVDTGGSLIDLQKEWAVRNEPSASKKSGGFSQQGYGFVKSEFLRLSADLRKRFNVIYLFHVAKDKNGDELFYDLVCEGSAKTLVWQPADLGAYLHIVNGERYLGFTPTMNYNAKSAYGIRGLVKVPELKEGDPNTFLTTLFAKVKENIATEKEALKPQQEAYEQAMLSGRAAIEAIVEPGHVKPAMELIKSLTHALTSERELKAALTEHLKGIGVRYNKTTKEYEWDK